MNSISNMPSYYSKPLTVLLGLYAILLSAAAGDDTAKTSDALSVRLKSPPGADQEAPLVCWSETLTAPRPLRLHFLRADLHDPRIEPCVILADDPDGAGPAEATLTSPQKLASRAPGLLAAVNANAFAHLASASAAERKRGWFAGKAVDIQGLAAADGGIRSESEAKRIPLWFDASKQPHLKPPAAGEKIRHGVADWIDLLLSGGEIVAKPSPVLHPRTLAGFDPSRRWLLLVVVDGRQRGTSEGMSLLEVAALMKAHGCSEAINLDGGGSSILLQRQPGQPGFSIVNHPSDGSPRPIPVMLGIRKK
jgi:hypothetical protein